VNIPAGKSPLLHDFFLGVVTLVNLPSIERVMVRWRPAYLATLLSWLTISSALAGRPAIEGFVWDYWKHGQLDIGVTVDPNGEPSTFWVEYGRDGFELKTREEIAETSRNVALSLTNLNVDVAYQLRLVVSNASGVVRGQTMTATPHSIANRNSSFRFLGIEWHVWKVIGWLGNVVFFSRFIIQWFATEKRKQVVVPSLFWWLSLFGTLLLLTYALFFKRDSVFIAAYAFSWIPYIRNLIIHRRHKKAHQACDSCGVLAPPKAVFCAACGTRLGESSPAAAGT
jgi:lipid-A-disaccharide synthase-like uncharacterized protein